MLIRTSTSSGIGKYLAREKLYAQHLAKIRKRFAPLFFQWIGSDKLHDATLAQLQLDEDVAKVSLEFHYVGEWLKDANQGKPIRPPTRRLLLDFTGVSHFSIIAGKGRSIHLLGAEFIISELNTHASIKGHRKQNSLTICFGGKLTFEMEIVFLKAAFRELEPTE